MVPKPHLGCTPQRRPTSVFCYTHKLMSQHTLRVNLHCSSFPLHLSRCKAGTAPLLSTSLHQRKKGEVRSLLHVSGRRRIRFYCLHQTLRAITGSHSHECFTCCLLCHPCCPNTKATPKVQGIKVSHTTANRGNPFLNPYQHQDTHPCCKDQEKKEKKEKDARQKTEMHSR